MPFNIPDEEMTQAIRRVLALREETVRQIMEEKARLIEAYQAQIAKLDEVLMEIAPETVAQPPMRGYRHDQ